mgnify:FL=1
MSENIENIVKETVANENSENFEKVIENVISELENLGKDDNVEEDVIVEKNVKLDESIFTMKQLKEKIKKLKKVDRLFAKLTGQSCTNDAEEDIPSVSYDNGKSDSDDNKKSEGDIPNCSEYFDSSSAVINE